MQLIVVYMYLNKFTWRISFLLKPIQIYLTLESVFGVLGCCFSAKRDADASTSSIMFWNYECMQIIDNRVYIFKVFTTNHHISVESCQPLYTSHVKWIDNLQFIQVNAVCTPTHGVISLVETDNHTSLSAVEVNNFTILKEYRFYVISAW